jgi:hypothetical protein
MTPDGWRARSPRREPPVSILQGTVLAEGTPAPKSLLPFPRSSGEFSAMTTTHSFRLLLTLAAAALAAGASTSVAAEGKLGYTDTALIPGTQWHIHDGDRPQPRIITPGAQFSQSAPAPSDANVLFDGTDLSKWEHGNGSPAKWKIENGYMEVVPKSGILRTKDKFGDFQLHLEFATPEKIEGTGQGRGNNGINIWGRYEVQVLDSYENKTYADGQCAALYGQFPPLVNASKGPGQWQTYDIIFEGPRWDAEGNVTKKAHVTVLHNGVIVHHRRELHGPTGHRMIGDYKRRQDSGHIELYEHGNPVRFRNIWLRPLGEYDKP